MSLISALSFLVFARSCAGRDPPRVKAGRGGRARRPGGRGLRRTRPAADAPHGRGASAGGLRRRRRAPEVGGDRNSVYAGLASPAEVFPHVVVLRQHLAKI